MKQKYTLSDLMEVVEANQNLLKMLVKQKRGNKEEQLFEQVLRRVRMGTKQVMKFLGVTRPHALNLMEKVGKNPGFKFIVGERHKRRGSWIIYDKSMIIQDQLKRIDNLFSKNEEVTFHHIMEEFGVDLYDAKSIAQTFVGFRLGYELERSKIVKKENVLT